MEEQLFELVKRVYNSGDIKFFIYRTGSHGFLEHVALGESEKEAYANFKAWQESQLKSEETLRTFKPSDIE